jgi:hypothetical protein
MARSPDGASLMIRGLYRRQAVEKRALYRSGRRTCRYREKVVEQAQLAAIFVQLNLRVLVVGLSELDRCVAAARGEGGRDD